MSVEVGHFTLSSVNVLLTLWTTEYNKTGGGALFQVVYFSDAGIIMHCCREAGDGI